MVSKQYTSLLVFALIYISYVCFYFNKKNYSLWLNHLIAGEGWAPKDAAVFGSTMELTYGASKLLAGPISDSAPPKVILCVTLAICSLVNLGMFQSGIYYVDIFLWGLNAFCQAFAWPALSLIFLNWFKESKARGKWLSFGCDGVSC